MQQLLWIETLLKLGFGLLLVVAPQAVIRLFGLPQTDTSFWPRLLGAVLVGVGGALYLEGGASQSQGLGLGGCVVINVSAVSVMTALLVLEAGPRSARGRAAMWLLIALLVLLSILEIVNL